jgi:hypothetical protein
MINLQKEPQSTGGIIRAMKNIFMLMSGDAAMNYVRKVYAQQSGLTVLYCSWGTEHPQIDQAELREFLGTERYNKVRNLQLHNPV